MTQTPTAPTRRHLFIGGRDRGLNWLRLLADRRQLPAAVYCLQEDEHETEQTHTQISRFCEMHRVPCKVCRRLGRDDEAEIARVAPDLIVVMGWRTLVSERVLAVPRFGSVGAHESLLPVYRGFAPVNWAVINGEKETGVSLFYMTATGVDNGDLIAQASVAIGPDDTAGQVYQRTAEASLTLLASHFDLLLEGKAPRIPQDESKATYTCARTPDDGLIDWNAGTRTIHNLVRGVTHPYPGAFSHFAGKRYRIWSGQPVEPARPYVGRVPGRIIRSGKGGVEVLTGDGIYLVKTASEDGQPEVAAETLFRTVRGGFGASKA
jgi:methionyl-tRNA formyltransferase